MRLALISCSKSKYGVRMKAKDIYSKSTLFSFAFAFAEAHTDRVMILSAKHRLLKPSKKITPYNKTLLTASKESKDEWYKRVAKKLNSRFEKFDTIIFCCSPVYYVGLIPLLSGRTFEFPVKGLSIGRQLAFYKKDKMKRASKRTLV